MLSATHAELNAISRRSGSTSLLMSVKALTYTPPPCRVETENVLCGVCRSPCMQPIAISCVTLTYQKTHDKCRK